ncbi:MAG: penicillin-binding protein [Flavobacteriales bacterium]
MMPPDKVLRLRAALIYGCLVAFALAIAVKLFSIQLGEGEKWLAMRDQVATSVRTVPADRGHIYSDDGRLLATSVPEYEVRMDMRAEGLTNELFLGGLDSLCLGLSALFNDRTAAEYRRELLDARARGERYFLVKRKVDHEQMLNLKRLPIFREGRSRSGLIAEKRYERKQWFGRLARRTIGDVPSDSGNYGLERGYEHYLHGTAGNRLERRLVGGAWMPVDDGEGQDPIAGSDIHTTIDINLQDVADAALEAQLRKNGAHHGCVVVMECATGHIKAISNLTLIKDSTYGEVENYAVGHATEPGSTFKTASLMVAMEDGLVKPEHRWDTHCGEVKFSGKSLPDSHGKCGIISIARALEVSSNTVISQAIHKAYNQQPARFIDGLRRMGIGRPLGVRIPGEAMPILYGPDNKRYWSKISLPWNSVGYGLTITPLQTLAFYNAIANNGRMMLPQFVSHVTRGGQVAERFEPVALNEKIASDPVLQDIRRMLEGVVDSGTATNLKSAHFKIAGKTGTAQIAQGNAGYKVNGVSYQASFVGYFPAEAPRYSCIVVVSSPSQKGYYGNVVAGPIFREIADKLYGNRLDMQDAKQLALLDSIRRSRGARTPVTFAGNARDLIAATQALNVPLHVEGEGEWLSTQATDSLVVASPRTVPGDALDLVPNVVGMGLKDALFILENRGLHVRIVGNGMVRRQSLRPGSRFNNGSAIILELA